MDEFADDAAKCERASPRGSAGQKPKTTSPWTPACRRSTSPSSRAPERDIGPTLDRVKLALDLSWATHRTPTVNPHHGRTPEDIHISYDRLAADRVRHEEQAATEPAPRHVQASYGRPPDHARGASYAPGRTSPPTSAWWTGAARARLSFFEGLFDHGVRGLRRLPGRRSRRQVGMGERWDATNVIDAGVSVITPDRLDHTKNYWLHDRRSRTRKSRHLKPGQVVVIMKQLGGAVLDILLRTGPLRRRHPARVEAATSRSWTARWESAARWSPPYALRGLRRRLRPAVRPVSSAQRRGPRRRRSLHGRPQPGWTHTIVGTKTHERLSPGRMQVVRHSPDHRGRHNPRGLSDPAREAIESSFIARIAGVYAAMGDKGVEKASYPVRTLPPTTSSSRRCRANAADVARLADIAAEVFGPDRVMCASHWPTRSIVQPNRRGGAQPRIAAGHLCLAQ